MGFLKLIQSPYLVIHATSYVETASLFHILSTWLSSPDISCILHQFRKDYPAYSTWRDPPHKSPSILPHCLFQCMSLFLLTYLLFTCFPISLFPETDCNMSSMRPDTCLVLFTPLRYFSKCQTDLWIQEFRYFLSIWMNEWMKTLNSQSIGTLSL